MSDNLHLRPSASPPIVRPKPSRSTTIGVVRGRTSPTPGVGEQPADGRPPTKRARKAINCEPCRNSKLKCDRNRPCSSCVLRGTSAMCYQDARAHEGSDPHTRGDDQPTYTRIDPAQEIARLRHSISLLEAYVFPNQRSNAPQRRPSDAHALVVPKKETVEADVTEKSASAIGMLGSQVQGGLYAGPTSAATHLIMNEGRDSEDSDAHSRQHSQDRVSDDFASVTQDYDRDLLSLLPTLEIIDGLLDYYFEYCNWIYRHVNQTTFTHQWEKYKSGVKPDRVVLSTACALMAIATHYLPTQHALLDKFNETHEEIGIKFFEVSTTSLQKHTSESRTYTLELVELLLVRTHFHSLAKTDSEEIWHVTGELVTIGTAMGLHRDPGKWRMHRDVAERRRWAWWHIILLERWQAFLFGRPLSIASHHFDTQLPTYCDPALDKTGRLYLPNIALFRLAFILGDIMDDAVSIRPVSYDSVQANDRALTQWMETLPPELDMDEFRVARSLASPSVAVRRLGVQSVIIRTSYYHIRFTLHRPYASASTNPSNSSKVPTVDPAKSAQSLEIAVSAADKLITMVGQSRPDFLANSSLAVPGHMNWQPFHCFSAAMFFSFQLIANPDQPGAGLFRASIRKAITTLEQARGIVVADKALDILNALCPLYSPDFPLESVESREKKRAHVLGTVRKLAFPYHDSHDPRRFGDSPGARGAMSSPANSSSVSPPMPVIPALPQHSYDQPHNSVPSIRNAATTLYQNHPQQSHPLPQGHGGQNIHSPQNQPQMVSPHSQNLTPTPTYQTYNNPPNNMSHQSQQMYDPNRYSYVQVEDAMWGAAVGFGHAEWSQFLDSTRTEGQSSRHLQGS
ncbi:Fusarisetin A cluster transcription factor fsa6 [Psilocybe cubensis]|uniref:Zn(2)-C6 fungal-type domain-containing protein n=2 Tax=Psilocybe cubensis TaxID=181762 RepID=A0A8H8CKS8_PSICU|nr:Fusarisetin A cluster transcription factor fsa6 [Psilocybe cubensis]KAH9482451.1 Fusarisetin A cluster transcription factor fsa6 [Psilocybe cubensis]